VPTGPATAVYQEFAPGTSLPAMVCGFFPEIAAIRAALGKIRAAGF
jgi:hypothetical protein